MFGISFAHTAQTFTTHTHPLDHIAAKLLWSKIERYISRYILVHSFIRLFVCSNSSRLQTHFDFSFVSLFFSFSSSFSVFFLLFGTTKNIAYGRDRYVVVVLVLCVCDCLISFFSQDPSKPKLVLQQRKNYKETRDEIKRKKYTSTNFFD